MYLFLEVEMFYFSGYKFQFLNALNNIEFS